MNGTTEAATAAARPRIASPPPGGAQCDAAVYHWRPTTTHRRRMPDARVSITDEARLVELHHGPGLTADEVLAVHYDPLVVPNTDPPENSWDLGVWCDGRLVAVIEESDCGIVGVRRLDRAIPTA